MKGVEDALGRLEGVRSVQVDLQTNRVRLEPDPRHELDLAAVPRAVARTGFRPGPMHVVARGQWVAGEPPAFRIAGWRTALPVAAESSDQPALLHAAVDWEGPVLRLVPGEPPARR